MSRQDTTRWTAFVCVAVVALAGAGKLADLAEFEQVLRRWGIESRGVQLAVGMTVPLLELGLGCVWLFGLERRWTTWAMIVAIVAFTGVHVAVLFQGKPPACGCFGRISRYAPITETASFVLIRNALLLGGLGTYALVGCVPMSGRRQQIGVSRGAKLPAERAFTLIEMIVVIALLGILIGLLVPHVARVRDKSREIKMATVVRSHAAVLTMYADDYRGIYPFLTNPLATKSVIRCESQQIALVCRFFDVSYFWHVGLADAYYSGSLSAELFGGRNPAVRPVGTSAILYPASFLARPEYWNLSTRTMEPLQFAPTSQGDVLFPAVKALVTEALQTVEPGAVAIGPCVGFVDGHGEPVAPARNLSPGPGPTDAGHLYESYSGFGFFQAPFVTTLDGTHGRDVR